MHMAQDSVSLSSTPSRQVLEEVPVRALKFLGAVSRIFGIRVALATRGYDEAEHQRAWVLVQYLYGYGPGGGSSTHDMAVRESVAVLDDWDERGFRVASAALNHRHPAQHDFLFQDLEPAQGDAAVLTVGIFLDRLDALESSPDRGDTRDADRAALETLAKRGIGPEERARLRKLVNLAKTVRPPPDDNQERLEKVLALHAWLEEWVEMAKLSITRRDHLIALGIVKRRKKKAAQPAQPGDNNTAPQAPAPVVAPESSPLNGTAAPPPS
jgi:hypothetical protein